MPASVGVSYHDEDRLWSVGFSLTEDQAREVVNFVEQLEGAERTVSTDSAPSKPGGASPNTGAGDGTGA